MGNMGENEAFCGPNEDHFSSLVLMRTKSSIEDLFATTVKVKQVKEKKIPTSTVFSTWHSVNPPRANLPSGYPSRWVIWKLGACSKGVGAAGGPGGWQGCNRSMNHAKSAFRFTAS